MGFDVIFLIQHYILYRDKWANPEKIEKRGKLLGKHENEMEF